MPYCPECGTEVSKEASFCASCGNSLGSTGNRVATATAGDTTGSDPISLQDPGMWEGVLTPGEKPIYEFSVSKSYRIRGALIWSVIWGAWNLVLWIPVVLYYFWYVPKSNAYLLTDKRLMVRDGFVSKSTKSVPLKQITDTVVKEPFFEKLFYGSGSLEINTAGSAGKELVLHRIDSPQEVKQKIDRLMYA